MDKGRGVSAGFVYWSATLTLKQPKLGADTTASGSSFQSEMVVSRERMNMSSLLAADHVHTARPVRLLRPPSLLPMRRLRAHVYGQGNVRRDKSVLVTQTVVTTLTTV